MHLKWKNGERPGWQFWLILLGAVAGILLLMFGSGFGKQEERDEASAASPTAAEELASYRAQLEEEICSLCESVNGVGAVTVALTLSGGFTNVYATEEGQNGGEQYVIVGSGSGASALLLSKSAPEICGIGIVCRGGTNAGVRQELISLLSAAYHVPANRIYVTEAKKAGV